MKKILILAMLVLGIVLAACSKKAEESATKDTEAVKQGEKTKDSKKNAKDQEKEKEEEIKEIKLTNSFLTKEAETFHTDAPVYKISYPDNWKVTEEDASFETVIIEHDKISNGNIDLEFFSINGDTIGGGGRFMMKLDVEKVADAAFTAGMSGDGETDYGEKIGKFVVAKLKVVGELNMDKDGDYEDVEDGCEYYALVPESMVGTSIDAVGMSGVIEAAAFPYLGHYAFLASPVADKTVSKQDEAEIVEILKNIEEYYEY